MAGHIKVANPVQHPMKQAIPVRWLVAATRAPEASSNGDGVAAIWQLIAMFHRNHTGLHRLLQCLVLGKGSSSSAAGSGSWTGSAIGKLNFQFVSIWIASTKP